MRQSIQLSIPKMALSVNFFQQDLLEFGLRESSYLSLRLSFQ